MSTIKLRHLSAVMLAGACALGGCSHDGAPGTAARCTGDKDPTQLAYIVANESDDLTVIDVSCMQIVKSAKVGTQSAHMGELNADASRFYIDSSDTNETVVVDTSSLNVVQRIQTPVHPTHITITRDGKRFAVMAEEANAVAFIDIASNSIEKVVPGLFLPHFARMSPDGNYAYVANLKSSHLSRIDLNTLEIDKQIALAGFQAPPNNVVFDGEDGFADAQIDQVSGLLYAAHRGTGKVLVYDTVNDREVTELSVGQRPWIVYAEHPFAAVARRHVVPNFDDQSASLIAAVNPSVLATLSGADKESYGVNYSPLVPDQAFIMNRVKHNIAVVDTNAMQQIDSIEVGGTTETASTSADGKYIVATVSSANRVVVIEAATHKIVKTFDDVGRYPWSVTMYKGQNTCH
jgi:DNA-binding beta-propeller fold protein YncE